MIPAPSYRSIVIFVTSALRNNSAKLTVYLIVTFCCALLLSATFGQHYDESRAHKRGSIRKPRQVASTSLPLKDPYASRPRIQTRNGHLLIEASQDKNIDFKTSGSRGSITINGYKLDRLLDVTKALEKSAQIVGAKTGKKSQEPADGPYDLVLRGLFESSERFVALEKRIENLNELIAKLKAKLKRIEPRVLKKVSKLTDRYNSLVDVLKRNDCFDQETGQPVCKNGATCLDTYNGFKCLCPNNYEGATCEQDIDECAKFRNTDLGCQNGAKCVNLPGGYKCECTSQYHGIHCTEQHDDCALSSSKSLCGFGKCINLARTVANQAHYECVCDQGWTTDGANPACVIDINECLVGQSSVISLPGSSNMSFNSLQTSAVWSNSLMAAYPCSQNPFVDCVNLPGSFQCGPCPPGYTGNGRICRDLDECALNNGGCSTAPLVECINTQGSRRCGPCPPGYTGDGLTCKRETACSAQPNGGCHMMARCIELEGVSLSSRLCVCKYPFVGEGVGVDGCRPLPGLTGPTFGSGGSGNNTDPAAQLPSKVESDCSPNPCLNMASCQLTDTSFECLCPAGFQGRICDEQVPVCGGRFFFSKGSMSFPQGGNFQELVKLNSETNSAANNFKPAATLSERHYNCNWAITVSNKMSIELTFSELTNKINPSKQVQLFLANTTSAHQIVAPPVCVEYLDVRERLEVSNLVKVDDNQTGSSKGRLLARFCTYTLTGAIGLQALSSKRSIVIMSESNMVDLDYSFAATRTQFGEPSLSFTLNWNKKESPCGGQLPVSEFGSLSSPKFPEFYPAGTECRYLIRVPPGKRVRIQFGELTLLTGRPHSSFCSDSLIILDGSIGSDRAMIFKHCANNSTFASSFQQHSIAPIISSSSTVELILDSRLDSITPLMKPKQQRGFYLTYSSEPAAPGCGGLYTLKSAIIKSADYEPNDQPVDNHNSRLAVQMAGFLDPTDSGQSSPGPSAALTNWLAFINENQTEFRSNSSRLAKLLKTRCEYEIRPADQLRNNKITLDWLDMPTAVSSPPSAAANSSTVAPDIPLSRRFFHDLSKSGLAFPTRWSLLDRCLSGRLTVFDDSPSPDGNGRKEIASFCAGDVYNASEHAALKPIISSGHVLYLVYESSSQNAVNASSDSDSLGPNGFKLHYSTVCNAVYNQQSGSINVDLDSEVNECIYHIVLPPNNTISLLIEPKLSDSTSLLALDGTCSAQAIFLDGAVQWNSSKQVVTAAERQLKTYRFATGSGQSSKANNNQASRAGNTIDVIGSASDATSGGPSWPTGETPVDSYWQYSTSQVHDIKEFEVCRLPALSFDSIWNHLSLLFRLKQNSDEASNSQKTRVQLTVRYQAEPSCGGIITESPGSIKLEQSRRITSLNSFPITAEQYEKLHKQQFVNPCAWILRSAPNKVIQFKFEAPEAEIKKRYSEWLSWSQKLAKQTNSPPAEFNCSQVFQESIEIYEPSLNKTRYLCPSELLDSNSTNDKHNWNPQSNVVFIRLHNNTLELNKETNSSAVIGNKSSTSNNNSGNDMIWPGKRPLANSSIVVKYKFVSSLGAQCGGRLLRDSGIIHSPRYPYNYPPRMNCVWIIQADPKQQVRLNFTKFDLENPRLEGCSFDYLELRNGPSSDSPLVGRFCGSELQSKVIVAHSSMMWLKFVSDRSFTGAGFEIQFDGAKTGCGGKLTSISGQIDSPNYPLAYGHTSDCEWSIEVSQSNRIELTIVDLDLSSDSVNCSTSGAQTDYLELIDSANKDSFGRSLGRYCHKSQLVNKTTIVSRSNRLYIAYKSQALDNSRGFRLTYRTNCAQIELNGLRGAIETPGYPKSYTSEINCSWIIKAPLGSNLTLAISDMDLEEFLTNYQQAELLKVGYKETSVCDEDIAEVWALNLPQQNNTNTSSNLNSNKSETFKLEFEARPGAHQSEAAKKFSKNLGLRTRQPKGGKLIRTLCGQLSDLSEADRLIDMSTNMAYIAFETDRYVEKRGFRIEWRARGCGGQQVGDTIQPVVYHETANLQRPTECVWTFDMFKSAMTIEFSLHSDMRSPDGQNNQCDDVSLTVYDGPTDQAPVLSRNCDSLKVRESIITSSGQALVKFYTSGRHNYGRSFSLSGWPSSREGCLPSVFDINTDYNRQAGSRKSPNYPDLYNSQEYHCYGLLTAAKGRLRIRIDELNIPVDGKEDTTSTGVSQGLLSQETCATSNNYLLIRNMVGQNVFEQYCGKLATDSPTDMARATVVLEQETAWTEFVTKNGARGRWKFTYDRLCGSVVYAQYPQELSSPNYPLRPKWPRSSRNKANVDTYDDPQHSENVCIWRISNSIYWRKPELDKKLHLSIINFVESENANDKLGTVTTTDCLRIFEGVDLSIRKSFFNLTEIDALYTPKVKICKQSDIKHTSLNYISQGSEIIVMITGGAIAKFRVRPFENYCGGEFHLNKAEFASLNYPQPYAADLDCHYFVYSSPGSRVSLKFLAYDLPEGEPADDDSIDEPSDSPATGGQAQTLVCDNVDHIEIWQLPVARKIRARLDLVGKLVGTYSRWSEASFLVWNELSNANSSDTKSTSTPFKGNNSNNNTSIDSKLSDNSTTIKTKSTISARLYQLAKVYHLFHETKYRLSELVQEQSSLSLSAFYENAKLIGRFCGKKAPNFATNDQILRDDILIRFRSHSPALSTTSNKQPKGFLAEYKIEYGGHIELGTSPSNGDDLQEGFIGSPMYPIQQMSNSSIRWNFVTKLDSVIQFDLVDLDLGSVHQECQDTLSVFDGLNPQTSIKLTDWCGHLSFKVIDKRRLDLNMNANLPVFKAFNQKVQSNLIRTIQTSSNIATVVYTNYKSNGSFLLRYRAIRKSNKTIDNEDTYYDSETPLESDELLRRANDRSGINEGRNASKLCSQTHRLSFGPNKNSSLVTLTSPNWPNAAPQDIECHWLVYTYENSIIKFAADPTAAYLSDTSANEDQYSWTHQRLPDACLDQQNNERRVFVAVHDGASPLAPMIARHCLPMAPVQFQSSGKHLLIRYVNAANNYSGSANSDKPQQSTPSNFNGIFKGTASIGGCGGQYHVLNSERIRDRSTRDAQYENNLSCTYYLFAANQDRVLAIMSEMSEFELSAEPTNSDCSIGDYIEIRDLPILDDQMDFSRSITGRSLGRFCAGKKLEHIESPGSAISVEFRTDSKNTAKGWELYVMSTVPRLNCPRGYLVTNLDEPVGRLTSPNWPHGFSGKRHCKYHLVAPLNQTIKLTFVRLQRPLLSAINGQSGTQKCADNFHYLDDNEARMLRYDSRPLREPLSPLSGALLRQLVKEVPCVQNYLSKLPSLSSTRFEKEDSDSLESQISDGSVTGMKKISLDEYWSYYLAAPSNAFTIETNSHILLLDYETKNLLPNEGFFAVYRTEISEKFKCSRELTYKIDSPSDVANDNDRSSPQNNLIESYKFGQETSEKDDFIQCEWIIKSAANPFVVDYLDLSQAVISYKMKPTSELESVRITYFVYQVLEIPPIVENTTLYDDMVMRSEMGKLNEVCGLNRLYMSDQFSMQIMFACGNLTDKTKWTLLDYNVRQVSLRTKNLRLKSTGSQDNPATSPPVVYRGLRAYYYEKLCPQIEHIIGEGIRIRSHDTFPNTSYSPGICRWSLMLSGGDYELSFNQIQFRAPENFVNDTKKPPATCDISNSDLDYIEFRTSMEPDAPVLARFCIYNQMKANQKAVMLNMKSKIVVLFVAGVKSLQYGKDKFPFNSKRANDIDITSNNNNKQQQQQQQQVPNNFGFDLLVVRIRNESSSEFCQHGRRENIYSFFSNPEHDYYEATQANVQRVNFLYPKNTHCEVEMNLEEGFRFNMSFKTIFDLEQSKDCQNDYVQLDDLLEPGPETATTSSATIKPVSPKSRTTRRPRTTVGPTSRNDTRLQITLNRREPVAKRIGRWCGKTRPAGYFASSSNRVRLTFHSNERIEGKGFFIEYSKIKPPGSELASILSSIQVS